jgi:valyl-tRNA synthetase
MTELPKTFDPAEIEARWYAHWEETNAFRPARPNAAPFTIVMPPPNVTGSLHIGHALDVTLQDILVRHARLQGKDALWIAGTDHAGIATQMVVERQMAERQERRSDFTREQFVEKVWDWKAESGGTITRQLRRLGASCDWANERFTMDEGFSKAVIKVFVDLYNEGLLYRDKRLVNWDPGLKTAISDLEVETREVQGKFWHFKYPLADGSGHISVATTRPETMLADMAVAVNPSDERYTAMIGKMVRLPITGRLIPIVADEHADPELGSGAVKITPGHDFNDFEVGKRAGFAPADMLNMLDGEGRVVQCGGIPDALLGLDRFEARKAVVAMLEADGALERVEDRVIQTPFGDRSGVVIEPWLTDQWYVDAKTLAGPAIEAVRSGAIKVVPQSWEKTWFQWLENIQPWCVSRQLWWGHRIPAWYGPKKAPDNANASDLSWTVEEVVFVALDDQELHTKLAEYYGPERGFFIHDTLEAYLEWDSALSSSLAIPEEQQGKVHVYREEDVLDTWFSSALWPFGTLGWPEEPSSPLVGEDKGGGPVASATEKTPSSSFAHSLSAANAAGPHPNPSPQGGESNLLAKHYPNDVLISGFDILFFWDARMAMQGLHFMKEVPWKTLYLHGLVRAPDGSKMSKSKGNTVDPLGLIDQYGADALRFTLAAMESQGRDIKLDEKRVEGYRNFATKLWNAARFLQGNGVGASASVAAPLATLAVNKWIIGEVVETLAKLDQAIADLRYDAMADAIYHFAWGTFCDWYIELVKGAFDDETRSVAGWAFDQILVMLHPFMPFITEELWDKMGARGGHLLIHAKWLSAEILVNNISLNDGTWVVSHEARDLIEWVIGTTTSVRGARNEAGIAPGLRLKAYVTDNAPIVGKYIEEAAELLERVCRLSIVYPDAAPDTASIRVAVPLATLVIPLEGAIDLDAERARLTKGIEAATKEAYSVGKRLDNPAFVEKAKPEAIAKARADHAEKSAEAERLRAALARLG